MEASSPKKSSFIVRIFSGFWKVLTWIRQAFFNLIFLFILAVILVAIFSPDEEPMPAEGPLFISLTGNLVDEEKYISPSALLLNQDGEPVRETNIRDLIEVINHAATDEKITGIVLQLDYFEGGGISKMQEVGQALVRFKGEQKPVIAFSDNYSQQSYFMATYADEIFLHNMGNILLTGYGLYRNYYKEALDKLEVDFHVFKVGEFKDFVEPYTRNSMSDASRLHNSRWLQQLWENFTQQVENARALEPGHLDNLINHIDERMAAANGNYAQLAADNHLVDLLGTRQDFETILASRFGANDDGTFVHIPYPRYKSHVLNRNQFQTANVGLIVATGTILDGYQPAGAIGGDSLSELIRQAREDDQLKALVLRIDSGGGSAFASELIRNELQAIRDKGVPVVISMGSVAASGGYWIAMSSDQVWATPSTITGSIGVFGLLPTVDKTLAKIGVYTDGIGTTDLAGALRIDRPLDPKAAAAYQQGVESIYDKFLQLVAENRGTSVEDVHKVAQGRVWSGLAAKELGLVDELGFLNDAIASAADMAHLDTYIVKQIERPKSTQELIMERLLEQSSVRDAGSVLVKHWAGIPPQILSVIEDLITTPTELVDNRTPHSAFALCFACIAP